MESRYRKSTDGDLEAVIRAGPRAAHTKNAPAAVPPGRRMSVETPRHGNARRRCRRYFASGFFAAFLAAFFIIFLWCHFLWLHFLWCIAFFIA